MEPVRLEIAPEVNLDYVRSDKFKTGTLSVQLITPINEKTASFGALLPSVLRRGTMSHPDMRSLSTALDLLYGSSIGCTVRKKGENQSSSRWSAASSTTSSTLRSLHSVLVFLRENRLRAQSPSKRAER